MIVSTSGVITENLYMIGPMGLPIYLLDAEQPVVFDAGVAFLGPMYAEEIKAALNGRPLAYCMLTHSHFDHCGAVGGLQRHFPDMTVASSERAQSVLQRPNALATIRALNTAAAADAATGEEREADFKAFTVDRTLEDGDQVRIGKDTTICVLETPGHTRDCLSYYIPEKKVLVASEALGIADQTGYIYSDFLVDYDAYCASMETLSRLDVDVICLGHYYAYTGDDARAFFERAKTCCRRFFDRVAVLLDGEDGNVDRVMAMVKSEEYDRKPWPKQPEPAYLLNLRSRIGVVQKKMELAN